MEFAVAVLVWFAGLLAVARAVWPPSKRHLRQPDEDAPPVCGQCLALARMVRSAPTRDDADRAHMELTVHMLCCPDASDVVWMAAEEALNDAWLNQEARDRDA